MQLQPNQLIELRIENESVYESYRTRVEDAYDDLLVVGVPIRMGVLVPIRVGTHLEVQFRMHNGIQEGRFTCQAVVEKRFHAKVPLLQLRLLSPWEKIQDRNFLRVPVSIDTLFVLYKEGGGELPPQSGVMLDLSAGGFLLRSDHEFDLDDEVRVSFTLKEDRIMAQATMVRFVPKDSGVDYGFAFLDLPEATRQRIIKFVFQRQITLAELARDNPK